MKNNFKIEIIEDISIVRFFNFATIHDIISAVDELSITQPTYRLWDMSCGANLQTDELRIIAEYVNQKFTGSSKVAIIAPTDLTFGLSRVVEVYRDQEFTDLSVFRTEKAGLEWLKRKVA